MTDSKKLELNDGLELTNDKSIIFDYMYKKIQICCIFIHILNSKSEKCSFYVYILFIEYI